VPPASTRAWPRAAASSATADFPQALSILIARLENSLRHLLATAGYEITKRDKHGLQSVVQMGTILSERREQLEPILSTDIVKELKVLLISATASHTACWTTTTSSAFLRSMHGGSYSSCASTRFIVAFVTRLSGAMTGLSQAFGLVIRTWSRRPQQRVAEAVLEVGAILWRQGEGERLGADFGGVEDGAGRGADCGQGGCDLVFLA
jgi:hypothetical protein